MFWGRPPLRGGARQPALPVECFTMSRPRPAGRRQPATINPPVPARKLWRCGAEAEIGEGEGKLSPESFPTPSPNPTQFPSKTFVNGAGGGSGGLAARALLEVPRSRPPVPGISPDFAGWLRRLSGRPSASEFQSPQRHHPDLRGPFPCIWNIQMQVCFLGCQMWPFASGSSLSALSQRRMGPFLRTRNFA